MQTTHTPQTSAPATPERPSASAGDDPAVVELLARIDTRLARLEAVAARLDHLRVEAEALAATAGDIADETAARLGDADARVRELTTLLERVTQPEMLGQLTRLADVLEAAPGLVAMAADTVDELAGQAMAEGVDPNEIVRLARDVFYAAASRAPELRVEVDALIHSGLLDPRTLNTLGNVARALAEASQGPPQKLGLFGALRALGDDDVQRAIGFLMNAASRFGGATAGPAALPAHTEPGDDRR